MKEFREKLGANSKNMRWKITFSTGDVNAESYIDAKTHNVV